MDPKERRGMVVLMDDRVYQEEKVNRVTLDLLGPQGPREKRD